MSKPVRIAPGAPVAEFRSLLSHAEPSHLAIADEHVADADIERLVGLLSLPGVASASPVPVNTAGITRYPTHPLLPPPPTLALPSRRLTALSGEALVGIGDLRPNATSTEELLVAIGERLLQRGWRHIGAPGLAMSWVPEDAAHIEPSAAWTESVVADLVGPANAGLEAHVSWASSQLGRLSVVVDGACITDDPHTGTQHLVVQVARELANTRRNADITLAVPAGSLGAARSAVAGTSVHVADRDRVDEADVLYRPYQMLFASELDLVATVGRRRLVGQLDMIGFSNPFYHPSSGLFALARNLQRHLMRTSDGVTFISGYGRASALAECPDLEASRLHVVSCGADPVAQAPSRPPTLPNDAEAFVLCLSATFWHKNRAQAISTFAALAERGYPGALVIVGPEPFYGRSTDADADLLQRLDPDVAHRVHFLGQASESAKWWLLEHADAVIYPSVVEGFGLVPFEAAAVGTPCVAYAGTAPGELLTSTEAVLSTWEPDDWAERVQNWLDDPDAGDRAVQQIRDVAALHTWSRCAQRTWEAIDATLAQPRRSTPPEEGGVLSRVSAWGAGRATIPGFRFTLARAAPAVRRRVLSATTRIKKQD